MSWRRSALCRVAAIVMECSWSEYVIGDNLSRFRWIPCGGIDMTLAVARHIVLAARPQGTPHVTDFRLEDTALPTPAAGQLLLGVQYLSLDTYMRLLMDDRQSDATTQSITVPPIFPPTWRRRVPTGSTCTSRMSAARSGRRCFPCSTRARASRSVA